MLRLFFLNVCISNYKYFFTCCFCYIPYALVFWMFIFIYHKIYHFIITGLKGMSPWSLLKLRIGLRGNFCSFSEEAMFDDICCMRHGHFMKYSYVQQENNMVFTGSIGLIFECHELLSPPPAPLLADCKIFSHFLLLLWVLLCCIPEILVISKVVARYLVNFRIFSTISSSNVAFVLLFILSF